MSEGYDLDQLEAAGMPPPGSAERAWNGGYDQDQVEFAAGLEELRQDEYDALAEHPYGGYFGQPSYRGGPGDFAGREGYTTPMFNAPQAMPMNQEMSRWGDYEQHAGFIPEPFRESDAFWDLYQDRWRERYTI